MQLLTPSLLVCMQVGTTLSASLAAHMGAAAPAGTASACVRFLLMLQHEALLQHTFKQVKYLQHTLTIYVYSNCSIEIKHLQHMSEKMKHFE
jgi:hypothetical protein